jgi:hypothetical protein
VVNATGVWVDALRQMDGEAIGRPVKPMVAPSQGVHIVVDREFLPSDHALMVPKTADGRVLFAVPWLGKLILGIILLLQLSKSLNKRLCYGQIMRAGILCYICMLIFCKTDEYTFTSRIF